MSYKLLKENYNSYEMQHPDGSTFTVAKHGLSKNLHEKIKGYAMGGLVVEPDTETDLNTANAVNLSGAPQGPQTPTGQESEPFQTREIAGNPVPAQASLPQEQTPQPQTNAVPQSRVFGPQGGNVPQQAPTDLVSQYNKNIGQATQAMADQAQAQAQAGTEQAKIFDEQQKKLKESMELSQANLAKINAENNQLRDDISNAKVDPNRYWNSKSTGGKVLSSIGILLSGLGAGIAGQENMALKVIDNSIQRDIEAQKMDLGKKENLLSLNMRRYGDMTMATQATALQLNAIVQGQIAASAAKLNSKVAIDAAKIAISELKNKSMIESTDLAQRQATLGAMRSFTGGGNPQNANTEMLPKDMRERVVKLPNGRLGLAATKEDAETVKKSTSFLGAVDNRIDEMVKFAQEKGTTLPGSTENALGKQMQNSVILELNKLHDLNRLNDNEFEVFKTMVPHPGAVRTEKAIAELMNLKKLIREKVDSEFSTYVQGYNANSLKSKERPIR